VATQAALREAHLRYHLSTVEVLTPEQIARYNQLRDYREQSRGHSHQGQHDRPR
jgi:Spy/CpxP family protein refolding chaperone